MATGVIATGALAAAAIMAFMHFDTWLGLSTCDVPIHDEVPAPDGSKVAVVFEKGCGVGSPLNTQVSLAPIDVPFSSDRNPPVFVVEGHHQLDIKWSSNDAIEIHRPQGEHAYRQESEGMGVSITY